MQNGKKLRVLFFCLIFSVQGMEYFQRLKWEERWKDALSAFYTPLDPNSGEFQVSYKSEGNRC